MNIFTEQRTRKLDNINISVVSRFMLENGTPSKTAAVISITDAPLLADINENDWFRVLRLQFSDLDRKTLDILNPDYVEKNNLKLFTHEQALDILKFVNEVIYEGATHLVIHCEAGVSRSAAVAAAICKIKGFDTEADYFTDSSLFFANEHVKSTILSQV